MVFIQELRQGQFLGEFYGQDFGIAEFFTGSLLAETVPHDL
jgi:hypothetical protein